MLIVLICFANNKVFNPLITNKDNMMKDLRIRDKASRSKIDFIFDILNACQEPRTAKSIFVMTGIFQTSFYELFDECIDKGLIEKIDLNIKIPTGEKRKKFIYYKITSKGNDFIILYDKMTVYIEKMNLIFK